MTESAKPWLGEEQPVVLGSATATSEAVPERPAAHRLGLVGSPRPMPKGWPKSTNRAWSWLTRRRAPMTVVVAGAAGGVGVSTMAALIGETVGAGSPGPTVVLDQCGSPWGDVTRRVLGQRAGLPGPAVIARFDAGDQPGRILSGAPTTPAGAVAVVDDPGRPSPLRDMRILVTAPCGGLVVDAGRADPWLISRLDVPVVRPIVVLVGRADMAGAESVCAALNWLRRVAPVAPIVVLSATAPNDRKRVAGAVRLVKTVTESVVVLPFDRCLSHGLQLRIDDVGKSTATAMADVLTAIQQVQEGERRVS